MFAEWDYNVVPSDLKFNNRISIYKFGTIGDIFMTKNAIMTHNIKKVKTVQFKQTKYVDESGTIKGEQEYIPSIGHSGVSSNNLKQENNGQRLSLGNNNQQFKRQRTMGQPNGLIVNRHSDDLSQFEAAPFTPPNNPNN